MEKVQKVTKTFHFFGGGWKKVLGGTQQLLTPPSKKVSQNFKNRAKCEKSKKLKKSKPGKPPFSGLDQNEQKWRFWHFVKLMVLSFTNFCICDRKSSFWQKWQKNPSSKMRHFFQNADFVRKWEKWKKPVFGMADPQKNGFGIGKKPGFFTFFTVLEVMEICPRLTYDVCSFWSWPTRGCPKVVQNWSFLGPPKSENARFAWFWCKSRHSQILGLAKTAKNRQKWTKTVKKWDFLS